MSAICLLAMIGGLVGVEGGEVPPSYRPMYEVYSSGTGASRQNRGHDLPILRPPEYYARRRMDNCTFPIEVVLVQDLSDSFTNDLAEMRDRQLNLMYEALKVTHPSSKFGVVAFRDKPVEPFGWPVVDFCYDVKLPLTSSYDDLVTAYSKMWSTGGNDGPENQFGALLAALKHSQIQWTTPISQSIATRLVVLSTDAPPHFAEDGLNGHNPPTNAPKNKPSDAAAAGYQAFMNSGPSTTTPPTPWAGFMKRLTGRRLRSVNRGLQVDSSAVPPYLPPFSGTFDEYNYEGQCTEQYYPSASVVRDAILESETYLAVMVFDAQSHYGLGAKAWNWFSTDYLGQSPYFYSNVTRDSDEFWPKLSSVIHELEQEECIYLPTTTEAPSSGPSTTAYHPPPYTGTDIMTTTTTPLIHTVDEYPNPTSTISSTTTPTVYTVDFVPRTTSATTPTMTTTTTPMLITVDSYPRTSRSTSTPPSTTPRLYSDPSWTASPSPTSSTEIVLTTQSQSTTVPTVIAFSSVSENFTTAASTEEGSATEATEEGCCPNIVIQIQHKPDELYVNVKNNEGM